MVEAGPNQEFDLDLVDSIVEPYLGRQEMAIPILQAAQEQFGYLPRPVLERIARKMNIPVSRLFGLVTFYAQFKLQPRGRNIIRVCKGTACHIQGGQKIGERIQEVLGIEVGQTTPDLCFTLEEVACIGACALAPVMMINDQPHGRLTPDRIKNILKQYS